MSSFTVFYRKYYGYVNSMHITKQDVHCSEHNLVRHIWICPVVFIHINCNSYSMPIQLSKDLENQRLLLFSGLNISFLKDTFLIKNLLTRYM